MKIETDAKLVSVYINSTDQFHGRSLYAAIVELCQKKGIAGATVMRAAEGYGAGQRLHTTRLLELGENLPVRIDIVDVPERIAPLLAALEAMVPEGLITLSDVRAIRLLTDPAGS
jgi:uncharacterized protein